MPNLVFNKLRHWSLAQLRGGAFSDRKGWSDHLTSRSIHTDEMDKSWEIFQVSKKKSRSLTLVMCVFKHAYTSEILKYDQEEKDMKSW